MTDQQINERIAVICGWKRIVVDDPEGGLMDLWKDTAGELMDVPPNYANDLNAMRDAEATINTPISKSEYVFRLGVTIQPNLKLADASVFKKVTATARQRAEAFLRAHNQWEEA